MRGCRHARVTRRRPAARYDRPQRCRLGKRWCMTEGPELEPNRSRLDRRAAMKAALAGVAAAAVWQAPRIEGLSVAPDVAQAASCTGGTATSGPLNAPEFKL